MIDRDLLRKAIDRAGYSARSFSRVLDVDERTVRRWLEPNNEGMPGPARQLCRVVAAHPAIARELDPKR